MSARFWSDGAASAMIEGACEHYGLYCEVGCVLHGQLHHHDHHPQLHAVLEIVCCCCGGCCEFAVAVWSLMMKVVI